MKKSLVTIIVFLCLYPALLSAQQWQPETLEHDLAKQLRKHVAILASDSLEGRGLGTQGKIRAKNYIAEQFQAIGLTPLGEDYFQHFNLRFNLAWVPATNVIGFLEGSDAELREEIIVIGAHYDHLGYRKEDGQRILYPGADDNASGTAMMIEMARFFADNPHKTKRSLLFMAFDAEESGLLGANYFVNHQQLVPFDQIKAMFSLDMLGMYDTNNALSMKGIASILGGDDIAQKVAGQHEIRLKNVNAAIERRTDTWPFGQKGVPAVHPFTGTVSPYHQPGDVYYLLEYEAMARVQHFLRDLVAEISQMPEITPSRSFLRKYSESHQKRVRTNTGLVVHQGTGHHKYSDDFFRSGSVYNGALGVFFQVHIGQGMTIQPELAYDFNGAQTENGRFYRHSIILPLSLQWNLPVQDDIVRPFVMTGGYVRYHLSAKDGDSWQSLTEEVNQTEWGVGLGFGIEVMRVSMAWTYRRGITEVFSKPERAGVRDANSLFSIGYRF